MTKAELERALKRETAARKRAAAALKRAEAERDALRQGVVEARDQQAATADILRVISASPADAQPVFDAIVNHARRLLDAHAAIVVSVIDGELRLASLTTVNADADAAVRAFYPRRIVGGIPAQVVRDREPLIVADVETDPRTAGIRELARARGYRSLVFVPMLRDGHVIGIVQVAGRDPGDFAGEDVELLETFAAQAVIAIENVRLFTEREEKNAQVTEALERQTATGEILHVISTSPTDVQPVFEAIADNAARLLRESVSAVFRFDGERLHFVTGRSPNPRAIDAFRNAFPRPVDRESTTGAVIYRGEVRHVTDMENDPRIPADARELARLAGYRCALNVPMVRDGVVLGMIGVGRREPVAFTAEQIELFKTFADQAVIAIGNVRLFTELQEKNRALAASHAQVTDALDRETATSEVLRAISRSPTDAQSVFDAIVDSAVRLTGASTAGIFRYDGELLYFLAGRSPRPGVLEEYRRTFPRALHADAASGRTILNRQVTVIPDVLGDATIPDDRKRLLRVDGTRSLLHVPMIRDGVAIGYIGVSHIEPIAFTTQQIELLTTFADQAVIAIENVRLFTELQTKNRALTEALDQQTATSGILGVISSSPTDVTPVLQTVAENAARLCSGRDALVYRVGEGVLVRAAHYGENPPPPQVRPLTRDTLIGRAVLDREVQHVADVLDAYARGELPVGRLTQARSGYRTILAVPLVRDNVALGVIAIRRWQVEPFSDAQIELVKTFADQAVIAIENVRLFTELDARNRDLTAALDQQTATSDILRVISRSQTDLQPVFQTIVDSAAALLRGNSAVLSRIVDDRIELAAFTSTDESGDALLKSFFPMSLEAGGSEARPIRDRVIGDRVPYHVADMETDPRVGERGRANARARGYRSQLVVPMLRHDEAVGTLAVTRSPAGAFADDEVALLQTFADQAVIAVENVRLFTELQKRTADLTRTVDQLTALGEISRAVSSTLDIDRVLNTIVARASQLAGADGCSIFEYDTAAGGFRMRATSQVEGTTLSAQRLSLVAPGEGAVGRLTETHAPVQIPDISAEGAYRSPLRDVLVAAGYHALLAVPMIQEDSVVGGLVVSRKAPGEFPAETVDLLQTFANQSALAIANARLFREIEEKSAQLEVANQHKSEFLANMSHELRTPLNAVIGFSDVLLEGMFGEINDKQAEYLRDILSSGKHLLSLINDILDLSKIEAGRMELDLSDFDVPLAISDALLLMRERATRQGVSLGQVIDERLGQVTADERKFKQVLLNLVSNAVKFTPTGGNVEVRARLVDSAVEVAVADTGEGIAPEDQTAVFEEFRQVGTSSKKVEGTGLGLALCRKFVELHGGTITVESALGAGSTFTFKIPASPGA